MPNTQQPGQGQEQTRKPGLAADADKLKDKKAKTGTEIESDDDADESKKSDDGSCGPCC